MYEHLLSTFEYVDADSPYVVVRLIHPVYDKVCAMIGRQFQIVDNEGQQEIKFDYEVVAVPDGFDKELIKTEDFITVLRNVFMAILEGELKKGPIMVQGDAQEGANESTAN
jgi:hypothetical protein